MTGRGPSSAYRKTCGGCGEPGIFHTKAGKPFASHCAGARHKEGRAGLNGASLAARKRVRRVELAKEKKAREAALASSRLTMADQIRAATQAATVPLQQTQTVATMLRVLSGEAPPPRVGRGVLELGTTPVFLMRLRFTMLFMLNHPGLSDEQRAQFTWVVVFCAVLDFEKENHGR